MLEQAIRHIKIAILITIIFSNFLPISNIQAMTFNMERENVKSISISYSTCANGMPADLSEEEMLKRNYGYFSPNNNVNKYIMHYIQSLNLQDDGKVIHGGDLSSGRIVINYCNGNSENLKFFSERAVDSEGKQYSVDHNDYSRLWDFLFDIKEENIVINNHVTFEPSIWAKNDVDEAIKTGLVPKWNAIDYTEDITRLEACQIIDNCMGTTENLEKRAMKNPYEDTNDTSVVKLYHMGILKGKTENKFCPYDHITREEFATIISKVYNYIDGDQAGLDQYYYIDYAEISESAKVAVYEMTSLKLFCGNEEGNFEPKRNIKKEEVIVVLKRLYQICDR